MKRTRASEYTTLIQFYEQCVVYNEKTGMNESSFVPVFSRWAKVKIIFREQLESVISGANTLRDRLELTLRYCDDIDSTMAFEYKNKMYNVSIIGDKTGLMQETSLLGESVQDGGSI